VLSANVNEKANLAASRYEKNEDFFVRLFSDRDMMGQVIQAVGGVLYERLKKRGRARG
jgi:type I restriction enzyme, R subunit